MDCYYALEYLRSGWQLGCPITLPELPSTNAQVFERGQQLLKLQADLALLSHSHMHNTLLQHHYPLYSLHQCSEEEEEEEGEVQQAEQEYEEEEIVEPRLPSLLDMVGLKRLLANDEELPSPTSTTNSSGYSAKLPLVGSWCSGDSRQIPSLDDHHEDVLSCANKRAKKTVQGITIEQVMQAQQAQQAAHQQAQHAQQQQRYNSTASVAVVRQTALPKMAIGPQSIAARHRRQRIKERTLILAQLIPGGANKLDMAAMFEQAFKYVRFLQAQCVFLESHNNTSSINCSSNPKNSSLSSSSSHNPSSNSSPNPILYDLVNSPQIQHKLSKAGLCIATTAQAHALRFDPSSLFAVPSSHHAKKATS